MKLNAFQGPKKKKNGVLFVVVVVAFVVVGIIIYRSYAYYEESKNYDVIKGMVPEYLDDFDVKVSLTVDGVPTNEFPTKDSGKVVDSINCDKGTTGSWDNESWMLSIGGLTLTRVKCNIHFVTDLEGASLISEEDVEEEEEGIIESIPEEEDVSLS